MPPIKEKHKEETISEIYEKYVKFFAAHKKRSHALIQRPISFFDCINADFEKTNPIEEAIIIISYFPPFNIKMSKKKTTPNKWKVSI